MPTPESIDNPNTMLVPYFDHASGKSVMVRAEVIDVSDFYARIDQIVAATLPDLMTEVHERMLDVFCPKRDRHRH